MKCIECSQEKILTDFRLVNYGKNREKRCVDCSNRLQREKRRKAAENKPIKMNKKEKIILENKQTCNLCNIEKSLDKFDWYKKPDGKRVPKPRCKDCIKIYRKNFCMEHKPHRRPENKKRQREYRRKYRKERFKTDINYKILERTRTYIGRALRKLTKSESTQKLIGCSIQELRNHLESQWTEDMSWENWSQNGWHIDHIIPCASFDLKIPEQQKECFHWTNLCPRWATSEIAEKHGAPLGYIGNINKSKNII